MSIRDELLSLVSQKPTLAPVKFCGKDLFVREMTGAERVAYEVEQDSKGAAGLENFRARLIVRTLVDESGARVFEDKDADAVGALPDGQTRAAFDKAAEVNSLTRSEQKDIEKK